MDAHPLAPRSCSAAEVEPSPRSATAGGLRGGGGGGAATSLRRDIAAPKGGMEGTDEAIPATLDDEAIEAHNLTTWKAGIWRPPRGTKCRPQVDALHHVSC